MMNLFVIATSGWDLTTFLTNSTLTVEGWIGLASMLVGTVMLGVSIWQIATGLMSHGKKQTNWPITIILALVGGVLSVSTGWDFFQTITAGGKVTIEELGAGNGGGTSLMFLQYFSAYFGL